MTTAHVNNQEMADVTDETDLTTLVGENDEFKKLVESEFQSSEVGNHTWGKAKVYTKDEFLNEYGSGRDPVVRNFLVAWIAHYRLGAACIRGTETGGGAKHQ